MRPDAVVVLLERYHILDTRAPSIILIRQKRIRTEPSEIMTAIMRADIDRALILLRQYDERLWRVIRLVHVIPYPDRAHHDYHEDQQWFMHHQERLRFSLTTRRQLAALDLDCSYSTVWLRCQEAYRFLASWL